jgi:hypothetical protein
VETGKGIDTVGVEHRFHFRLHLLGDRVSLEAFELKDGAPGGYQFQMLAEADADLFALLGHGQMLMGFEGWQFKLEIRDRSEEI